MARHSATSTPFSGIHPDFAVCVLLTILTGSAFWKITGFEFVNYDTYDYIRNNPMVTRGVSWEGIAWAFTTFHMSNWHPVSWLSHMLDVELFGLHPGGHHLMNLILHVGNTLLIYSTLRAMARGMGFSVLVAVFFAVHPIHVESVAWVAERKDCLSTLFGLLAIWFYVGYVQRRDAARYAVSLICFALGLMAKPMVVTLPFVLLLLDYWPLGRFATQASGYNDGLPDAGEPLRRLIVEKVPFFMLTTAACIVTYLAQQQGGSVASLVYLPLAVRLLNVLAAYLDYVLKMIVPLGLAVFYPFPTAIPLLKVFSAALLITCLSLMAVLKRRRYPWFPVGWFWFLGTLVPVIGIVQVGNQAMADRYMYLPSIGFFIVVVGWGTEVARRFERLRPIFLAVAVAAILTLTATTSYQLAVWRDSVSLFSHTLKITGDHPLVNYYLGAALADQGRQDAAMKQYMRVLAVDSTSELANLNMGVLYQRQGKHARAAEHYRQALATNPFSWKAHHNLGLAYMAASDTSGAMDHYHKALEIAPRAARVHNSLAVALLHVGNKTGAVHHLQKALAIDPGYLSARKNMEKITR